MSIIALIILGMCFSAGLFYCLPIIVRDGVQCVRDVIHNNFEDEVEV